MFRTKKLKNEYEKLCGQIERLRDQIDRLEFDLKLERDSNKKMEELAYSMEIRLRAATERNELLQEQVNIAAGINSASSKPTREQQLENLWAYNGKAQEGTADEN